MSEDKNTSFLEIVEVEDGTFALRRMDDESPLVIVEFSDEARAYLQDHDASVAKAMINAGVQHVAYLSRQADTEDQAADRVIH